MYCELGEIRWQSEAQGARRIHTALWTADANGLAQKPFPLPVTGLLLEVECLNYGSGGTWDVCLRDEFKIDQAQGLALALAKGKPAVRKSLYATLGSQRVAGVLHEGWLWLNIAAASGDYGVVRVVCLALDAPRQLEPRTLGAAGQAVLPPDQRYLPAAPGSGCRSCGG